MKVTMEQAVHRSLLGLEKHVLWHPITYKDRLFVVELTSIATGAADNGSGEMVLGDIYEYSEEKRVFRGHKGRLVWSGDLSVLRIDAQTELRLAGFSADDFKTHLPFIAKKIFEKYEDGAKEEYKAMRILEEREEVDWDGVVDV